MFRRARQSHSRGWFVVVAGLMVMPSTALAGMGSYTLTDIAGARLEVISFFIILSLGLAFVFKYCWNSLARDFPRMPALNYRQAFAAIFVASLFCGLILVMISGTRELMTPGAWDRVGTHYELREPKDAPMVWLDSARRRALEQLRDALWEYARHHDGTLPNDPFAADLPAQVWRSPDPAGTQYGYLPPKNKRLNFPGTNQATSRPDPESYVIAYEPLSFGSERFVLLSSGDVIKMKARDLVARVAADTASDAKVTNQENSKS